MTRPLIIRRVCVCAFISPLTVIAWLRLVGRDIPPRLAWLCVHKELGAGAARLI